jgi:hypothetical protein
MATFDTYADAPFQIKREGQEIVVRQSRISPTTIRISWTLPSALTCNLPYSYNGAIVTLASDPTALSKLPVDGSVYTADATADSDLHSGSKIGTAKVVGAFYNDVLTSYVDVMDAPEGKAFYASVHAVDNVNRYHTDGAHSYSLPYGKDITLGTSGYQMIFMGANGIFGTTPTNLDPLLNYNFKLSVDGTMEIPVTISGADADTYDKLITAINTKLKLHGAVVQSPEMPAQGQYWLNVPAKELKQWDGIKYTTIPGVYFVANDPLSPNAGDYWYNPTLDQLSVFNAGWEIKEFHNWPRDPRNPYCNDFWYDGTVMRKWNGGAWVVQTLVHSAIDPALAPIMTCHSYWVHDDKVYQWDEKNCIWVLQVSTPTAPTTPTSGMLHLDATNHKVYIWSDIDAAWIDVGAVFSTIDPSLVVEVAQNVVWHDTIANLFFNRDGTSWVPVKYLKGTTKPQLITDGALWFNSTDKKWYKMAMGMWIVFIPVVSTVTPNVPLLGAMWYQASTFTLWKFDGSVWVSVPFSTTSVTPAVGTVWYNTTNDTLYTWTGTMWAVRLAPALFSINELGNIKVESSTTGSKSSACISDPGTLWNTVSLTPVPRPQQPMKGTDPLSSVPAYQQAGVGTDGSQDERRALVSRIKSALGYPVMQVELTKDQIDMAIDMALEKLRAISSAPYRRGYFALDLQPRVQKYILTNETVGHNKIVDVLYVYRPSASYLSTAAGNDVYGQMMIQSLFTMGKFDLLSHHMMTQYTETMRQVFATEIQHSWDEHARALTIYKDLPRAEKVLVDAMVERTEQDLMSDRWTRPWIQKYATAQCRYMLSEIRGKFSTLPGAGGAVTLNAADLRSAGDKEIQECIEDVDNYVVGGKTEFGMASDFVLG